jgi:hypothetical protein
MDDMKDGLFRGSAARSRWLAVLLLAALPAVAGARGFLGLNRDKGSASKPVEQFAAGTLQGAVGGGWELGGQRVVLAPDCVVVMNGKVGDGSLLRDGLDATVIGRMAGGVLQASCITAAEPVEAGPRLDNDPDVEWSTEDSSVGWGTRPR